ncbi:MAG: pectate lyase [Tepidisphaeraceae bacterium]
MCILARAYRVTQKPEYKQAVERALKMTLHAQYANGGWPQEYPVQPRGYSHYITFNDDAMTHILKLVRSIGDNQSPDFAFVDDATRARCREAFTRGIQLLLDSQIRVDGKPTVWCARLTKRRSSLPRPAHTNCPATAAARVATSRCC